MFEKNAFGSEAVEVGGLDIGVARGAKHIGRVLVIDNEDEVRWRRGGIFGERDAEQEVSAEEEEGYSFLEIFC